MTPGIIDREKTNTTESTASTKHNQDTSSQDALDANPTLGTLDRDDYLNTSFNVGGQEDISLSGESFSELERNLYKEFTANQEDIQVADLKNSISTIESVYAKDADLNKRIATADLGSMPNEMKEFLLSDGETEL
jgi:hypothetical protein